MLPRPLLTFALVAIGCVSVVASTPRHTYRAVLDPYDPAGATGLVLQVNSLDATTGAVSIGVAAKMKMTGPFIYDWGDNSTSTAGAPASHTYSDKRRNYIVTLTTTSETGITASAAAVVRFAPPVLKPRRFDPALTVRVPTDMPDFTDTYFAPGTPTTLRDAKAFSDFPYAYDRATAERVASALAEIEHDLVNRNVFRDHGTFAQVAVRNATFGGGLSFWYTSPLAFGIGDAFLNPGTFGWGTFAHEMGHNFTLNSPATFRPGGRTDGNAAAFYSETLARIVEYVACYQLANHANTYGIPDDLALDIFQTQARKLASATLADAGKLGTREAKFSTWNDPATSDDETTASFSFLASQFLQSTALDGTEYRNATKRLMWFFSHWSPAWVRRYDAQRDTAAAETFRSTLLTTAVSFAVQQDLKPKFRAVGFPIDDAIRSELLTTVGEYPGDDVSNSRLGSFSTRANVSPGEGVLVAGFVVTGEPTQVLVRAVGPTLPSLGGEHRLAAPRLTLLNGRTVVATNTNWSAAVNADAIGAATLTAGAMPFPEKSGDSAILIELQPGAYTAQIGSADGTDGVALLEIYELGGGRLSNWSTRTRAAPSATAATRGFVVSGPRPKNLLVRYAGPTLSAFGVEGALARPALTVYRGAVAVGSNSGWSTAENATEIGAATRTAGAFSFPVGSSDAALFLSFPPGAYTVRAESADGTAGIGLVEVYDLDAGW